MLGRHFRDRYSTELIEFGLDLDLNKKNYRLILSVEWGLVGRSVAVLKGLVTYLRVLYRYIAVGMQWLPCRGLCYVGLVRCGSGVRWTSVIFVGLFGSWIFGSVECGRNCTGYDIKCVNGQCVDESQTMRSKVNESRSSGVNKTPKVSCQCDPLWSGLSCDIFTCSGRMQ